jgi:DNA-binding CsgD family transcriptional regulator
VTVSGVDLSFATAVNPMIRIPRPHARHHPAASRPQGAVLLGFLILLAATGWTLSQWSQRAVDESQREYETELLWVGGQYRQAIESYFNGTPMGVKQLPGKLEDLIEDKRFPKPRRHLRKIYTDPMRPGKPLEVLMQGQKIIGVHSLATGEPFRRMGFDPGQENFSEAKTYRDWRFVANIRIAGPSTAASAPAAASAAGSSSDAQQP